MYQAQRSRAREVDVPVTCTCPPRRQRCRHTYKHCAWKGFHTGLNTLLNTHTHTHPEKEQLVLPMEIKEGLRKEGSLFYRVLEEPVEVYQAENRLRSIPATRKAHCPLLVMCLQPALSPT